MSHSERSTAETAGACGVTVQPVCGLGSGRAPAESSSSGTEAAGEGTEPRTSAIPLEYIHDGVVQLSEHHKVDRKAGGAVLGGRIAREPGQSVVLLQNKPAERRLGSGCEGMGRRGDHKC